MYKLFKKIIKEVIYYKKDLIHKIRINKSVTNIFGYQYSINSTKINIITTYRCNCLCFDCSQNCRQAPTDEKISTNQIKKFILENIKNKTIWKEIFVMGGESLLEKNIFLILSLLLEYKNKCSPRTKIILITNGYGQYIKKQINNIPKGIIVRNTKKTSNINPGFYSINIAPKDLKNYKNVEYKNGCYILKRCGLSLTRFGYYACPNMGAIDRVFGFNIGRKKFPKKNDSMRDQMNILCRYCGLFLYKGYRHNKLGTQSKSLVHQFKKYKRNKPKMTLY